MGTGLNNELISISKYYKFNFRVAILLVLMVIGFNYFLIPRYSVYGAAWGATLALAMFNLLKVIFLWYKMRLHPFNKKTILVIAAGTCSGLAGYYLPSITSISGDTTYRRLAAILIDAAYRSLAVIVIYSVLLVASKASDDLNTYLKNVRSTRKLY
jgi:O-antigen/teichoic acid export membrane protein